MGFWSDILDTIEDKAQDVYNDYVEPVYDEYVAPAYNEYVAPVVQEVQSQLEQPIGTQYSYTQPYEAPVEEQPSFSYTDLANNLVDTAQNVRDDVDNAWNTLPYVAQLGAGLVLGNKASKATLATPMAQAGLGVLKRNVSPMVDRAIMQVVNNPEYKVFRQSLKPVANRNKINLYHPGHAAKNWLNEKYLPSAIGATTEAVVSSDDMTDIPKNMAILPVSKIMSNGAPLTQQFAIQDLENYLQGSR